MSDLGTHIEPNERVTFRVLHEDRDLRRRVAVWSNGADGVSGGGKAGDDVKTW